MCSSPLRHMWHMNNVGRDFCLFFFFFFFATLSIWKEISGFLALWLLFVGVGVAETNESQEYILKFEEHQDATAWVGHKDLQLHFHHKAPGPSYLAMTISVLISISLAGQHPN